jgi:hypothetical protein
MGIKLDLSLGEELSLRVFENKLLKKIVGHKRDAITPR